MKKRAIKQNQEGNKKSGWLSIFLLNNKFSFGYLIYLVIFGAFLYLVIGGSFMRWNLAKNGIVTKAFIYDSKTVGGKGTVYYYFSYKVGANIYRGDNGSSDFIVGDSVYIVYNKSNPEKFWPLTRLEDQFPAQLKSNLSYKALNKKALKN